jgi:hypothetical protein
VPLTPLAAFEARLAERLAVEGIIAFIGATEAEFAPELFGLKFDIDAGEIDRLRVEKLISEIGDGVDMAAAFATVETIAVQGNAKTALQAFALVERDIDPKLIREVVEIESCAWGVIETASSRATLRPNDWRLERDTWPVSSRKSGSHVRNRWPPRTLECDRTIARDGRCFLPQCWNA